ncbi:hypothetical protein [Streptomyces virginiae]|uniref:hypothetical protein n=1 Tax=Streptomyces virginiae TaxID=1961 RepID=UPI003442DFA5
MDAAVAPGATAADMAGLPAGRSGLAPIRYDGNALGVAHRPSALRAFLAEA